MHLLTAPTVEPVTLAEAKLAARITETLFDAIIPGLIASARQLAEQATGQMFMAQTWRTELVDWPAITDTIAVPQATAAALSYWTGSAWATLSGAGYAFAPAGSGTALAPALGTTWPALGTKALGARVRIDLTAGAADANAVPECVKLYIKALVAHWVFNPSAAASNSTAEAPFLRLLLDPARLWS